MRRILLTGMSGSGKSSAIRELARRGHLAVDLDAPEWSEWATDEAGQPDWVWQESRVRTLLESATDAPLFVSGCMTHQGRLYPLLEEMVLLSAPVRVLLERVIERQDNLYGKTPAQQADIWRYVQEVEPLLRAGCTLELDTLALSVSQIADRLEQLANN